eukprot:TRINITY_DN45362_c0_g1_i1.p1 TRINITY_DN45362_c0_g1~~TRINITY_DN45362_c0_g1_i1.p1  ORF type:complete len:306 (-),score=115.78 TRINITY_DN45362_c0_g1_i1:108-1025(-)
MLRSLVGSEMCIRDREQQAMLEIKQRAIDYLDQENRLNTVRLCEQAEVSMSSSPISVRVDQEVRHHHETQRVLGATEAELSGTSIQLEGVTGERNMLRDKNRSLADKLEASQAEAEDLRGQNRALTDKCASLESDKLALEMLVDELRDQAAREAEVAATQLHEAEEAARRFAEKMTAELGALQLEKERLAAELEAALAEMARLEESVKQQVAAAELRCRSEIAAVKDYAAKVEEGLRSEVSSRDKQMLFLKQRVAAGDREVAKLKADLQELKEAFDAALEREEDHLAKIRAVSYTHLTLPTKRIV